jgi:hypothetical protein
MSTPTSNLTTIDTMQHDIYMCQCRVLLLEKASEGLKDQIGEEISDAFSENFFLLNEHLGEISETLEGIKSQVNLSNVLEASSKFAQS